MVAFASLASLIVLIGVLSIVKMGWFNAQYIEVATNSIPSIRSITEVKGAIIEVRRAELRYLITDAGSKSNELNNVNSKSADLTKKLNDYGKLVSLPGEKQLYDELQSKWQSYQDNYQSKVINLESSGKHDDAIKTLMVTSLVDFSTLQPTAEKIADLNNQYANELLAKFNDGYDSTRTLVVSILVIALIFAVALGVAITKSITGPVNSLVRQAQQVADGDLTKQLSLTHFGNDEVGVLAKAFVVMQENLKHLISNVSAATDQLTSALEEVSTVAAQSSHGVRKQMAELDQLATAINEMQSTVQDVARNCTEAANSAHTAAADIGQGMKVVNESIHNTELVQHEINEAGAITQALQEDSRTIGGVLDVIRGIAEQTNLLALNAAIEAARAGEQGRGFAVVADEVRTLAKRTQDSTAEVNRIIAVLQKRSEDTMKTMESSRHQMQITMTKAREAGEAIARVTNSVDQISDMNNHIATATEEQNSVTETLNQNIVSIHDSAQEVSVGSEQTAEACNSLSQLAIQLQGMVQKFRV